MIDKQSLRNATYSSRVRMSRAILSLFANARPKDWEHCDREVLAQNLFFSTDKPNLHHIFPTNSEYVLNNQHNASVTMDYIRARSRILHKQGKCDMVLIDYLQLASDIGRNQSREQAISQMSRTAKIIWVHLI